MPYTTELTQDCVGIVHAGSGVVTGAELLAACTVTTLLVQNTANFQYEFADFSDVTELRIDPEAMEKIVAQDRLAAKSRPRAIVIIVAPRDDSYAVVQRWEERVRDLGWTIHLSRERAEALRWLTRHLKTKRPELLRDKKENVA